MAKNWTKLAGEIQSETGGDVNEIADWLQDGDWSGGPRTVADLAAEWEEREAEAAEA